MRRWGTAAVFIAIIIIGTVLSCCCYCCSTWPSGDEIVRIGQADYTLSLDARQYIVAIDRSNYPADKYVVIINEPHYSAANQYSLYKGLELFFEDNPGLAEKAVFLCEGVPAGESLSVRPLVDVEPDPDEDTIEEVLNTFLINGPVAYEWKHQKGIPLAGVEDDRLYDASARTWIGYFRENETSPGSVTDDEWMFTVTSRNREIADAVVRECGHHECVILFVGGMHLDAQDDESYERGKSIANLPGTFDNGGIIDYLEEEGIGYTYLEAYSKIFLSEYGIDDMERYTELMECQQAGDYYGEYIEDYMYAHEYGVCVRPSAEAAAAFLKGKDSHRGPPRNGDPDTVVVANDQNGFRKFYFFDWLGRLFKMFHEDGHGGPHMHDFDVDTNGPPGEHRPLTGEEWGQIEPYMDRPIGTYPINSIGI